ncbi:MAG: DUF370 domain-containing protein [Oscillospiraceae bacterium]
MVGIYLHVGNDVLVKTQTIVGIFDIETTSISKITKKYLALAQKKGEIITVTNEIPKTFIVCMQDTKTKIYISQISCATLRKRAFSNATASLG